MIHVLNLRLWRSFENNETRHVNIMSCMVYGQPRLRLWLSFKNNGVGLKTMRHDMLSENAGRGRLYRCAPERDKLTNQCDDLLVACCALLLIRLLSCRAVIVCFKTTINVTICLCVYCLLCVLHVCYL